MSVNSGLDSPVLTLLFFLARSLLSGNHGSASNRIINIFQSKPVCWLVSRPRRICYWLLLREADSRDAGIPSKIRERSRCFWDFWKVN